jgi:malonate decarboxylase epsilon subunit
VGNVTGKALRSAQAIAWDFASNISHGVRWYDMTTVLEELGCRLFLEVSPGHVLTHLAADAFPEVRALAVGESSLSTHWSVCDPPERQRRWRESMGARCLYFPQFLDAVWVLRGAMRTGHDHRAGAA